MHTSRRARLEVGGIPLSVRYGRATRMRITVRPPEGEVRVSAPETAHESDVVSFVTSKLDWIARARKQLTVPADGTIEVWGRTLPLVIRIAPGRPRVEVGNDFLVTADSLERIDAVIEAWRRRELARIAEPLIDYWSGPMNVAVQHVTFRAMTSRWGTCNARTHRVTLSTHLTKHPQEYLEYVVVHELAHLRVPNHSSAFWSIVAETMPDWRRCRDALNRTAIR